MITTGPYLNNWSPEQYQVLEKALLVAKHRLHETGLFSDEALAQLIDTHPDEYLTIAAMGTEASKFEWMVGDRNGVSAEQLIQTVKDGKLWINLIAIERFHDEYRRLIDDVYNELEAAVPNFKARNRAGNLLISSPNAMVYFHTDLPVNMLWHLRGEKRVWVYPFDERFVSEENMEKLAAGKMSEDMPFEDWYNDYAVSFKVQPGQLITWPQNTPHMVKNLDSMNVSLSTEHRNPVAKRKIMVYKANYFLRQKLGIQNLSSSPHGLMAHAKQFGVRVGAQLQRLKRVDEDTLFSYGKKFFIDPSAPQGYTLYDDSKQVDVPVANSEKNSAPELVKS